MTKDQIDKLVSKGNFPETGHQRKVVETHISWVILCEQFVYKIKKPIKYSFLDFSTLKLRKHFCERELELNQRFSKNIYLEVLPVYQSGNNYAVGSNGGILIDYVLKMRKLDPDKQMDVLLAKNEVNESDIKNLAENIADFHRKTEIIYKKNVLDIKEKFSALNEEKEFLTDHLEKNSSKVIECAIEFSTAFLIKNRTLLKTRLKEGFFRDCHGDLHTRNIFLLPEPQPFDCIEFNDDYRQIDVLNEVAFLCMDLDALGKTCLSTLFMEHYNCLLPTIRNKDENKLFLYYKAYRANVRAKVNSLRAKNATDPVFKKKALLQAKIYLALMDSYLTELKGTSEIFGLPPA